MAECSPGVSPGAINKNTSEDTGATLKKYEKCGPRCLTGHISMIVNKPRRLDQIFQTYDPPLYFVTFSTHNMIKCLDNPLVHEEFRRYSEKGVDLGYGVGRYVIMPDHIHLFIRINRDCKLGNWIKGLKRAIGNSIPAGNAHKWQEGFFDHVIRSNESYAEKWEYFCQNPVRKGLVSDPAQWPYQGEICVIDRV